MYQAQRHVKSSQHEKHEEKNGEVSRRRERLPLSAKKCSRDERRGVPRRVNGQHVGRRLEELRTHTYDWNKPPRDDGIRRLAEIGGASERFGALAIIRHARRSAGVELHGDAVATAYPNGAARDRHLARRDASGTEARIRHDRHTTEDDAAIGDVGTSAHSNRQCPDGIGGIDSRSRTPHDVVFDVKEIIHTITDDDAGPGPEDTLTHFRTERSVDERRVLVVFAEQIGGTVKLAVGTQFSHNVPTREFPLASRRMLR